MLTQTLSQTLTQTLTDGSQAVAKMAEMAEIGGGMVESARLLWTLAEKDGKMYHSMPESAGVLQAPADSGGLRWTKWGRVKYWKYGARILSTKSFIVLRLDQYVLVPDS